MKRQSECTNQYSTSDYELKSNCLISSSSKKTRAENCIENFQDFKRQKSAMDANNQYGA